MKNTFIPQLIILEIIILIIMVYDVVINGFKPYWKFLLLLAPIIAMIFYKLGFFLPLGLKEDSNSQKLVKGGKPKEK